ncbi:kinase-like domain-containing protein [Spinellus fusiger]|nr:kinase-like domain-containing protein [Spinellus fusiger]
MTIHLSTTYSHQQGFHYNPQQKPRRVLTQPSKPGMNDGYDNENCDYILWVNDILGDTAEHQWIRYRVIDLLGFGTYGQVVKCEHLSTGKTVSVKVIKNKAAYRQQSRIEVDILTKLKEKIDKNDSKRILKLLHTFVHKNHFCMVFELLSYNIYQVLKQNQFRGFSMDLIRVFTLQLLDTLVVLKESKIIHCDLKPENMLLKSLDSPTIKVIDFGASCYENNPILMYIQSRYYRAPEIIIGAKYSSAIDMWSLGCIVAELFLGTPIFPGNSEYNQIYRITDLLGLPPPELLATGKSTSRYFNHYNQSYGPPIYRLKSREQYAKEQSVHEMEGKKYYTHTTLEDILMNHREYPSALNEQERQRGRFMPCHAKKKLNHWLVELQTRRALVDFLKHTLVLDPLLRWRPHEARLHPFITGEPMDEDSLPSSVCSSPIIKTSLTSVKENHASKSTHSLSLAANTVEESKHSTNTHLPVMITEPLPPMNYVGVSEPTLSLSKGKEKPNMRGTWRFSYHHLRPSLLGSFTEKKLMRAYKASEK